MGEKRGSSELGGVGEPSARQPKLESPAEQPSVYAPYQHSFVDHSLPNQVRALSFTVLLCPTKTDTNGKH